MEKGGMLLELYLFRVAISTSITSSCRNNAGSMILASKLSFMLLEQIRFSLNWLKIA
jgi:hypothetical protein